MSVNYYLACLDCTGNAINLGTIVTRKYADISAETRGFSFLTHDFDKEKTSIKAIQKLEEIEHYFLLHMNHHLIVTSSHSDVHAKHQGFPRGFPFGDNVKPKNSRPIFMNQPINKKIDPIAEAQALPDYVKKKIEKF